MDKKSSRGSCNRPDRKKKRRFSSNRYTVKSETSFTSASAAKKVQCMDMGSPINPNLKMAYVMEKKKVNEANLSYLPLNIELSKTKESLVLDFFKPEDYEGVYEMMKDAVDEGQTYPQDSMTKEEFEKYYLSDSVFVGKIDGQVAGAFYVKPNFPGRSSHICNAGFLVNRKHRMKGIGEVLFTKYLRIAKDLGYEGSFFNLVYATNQGSVRLCRKLGFKEIAVIPKAGKMKDLGYVDAYQFYYDLTTYNPTTSA